MGSSRSGTSLTASLFRTSGHFYGNKLLPPSVSNPKGYYEDRDINLLNNQLIDMVLNWPALNRLRKRFSLVINSDHRAYPMAAPLWLRKKSLDKEIKTKIRKISNKEPFCFKDPRFNVTLPFWKPFLPQDTRFICVFRDPYRTADSQLRNAREVYSPPIPITLKECNLSWYRNYKRLLYVYSKRGQWLFVNYDMIIAAKAIRAIEHFAETTVDISSIDPSLSRAKHQEPAGVRIGSKLHKLYDRLQARANIDIQYWSR